MYITGTEKEDLQLSSLPEGHEIVTEGEVKPGDIRWNIWNDCWNTEAPIDEKKHSVIIGDPVKSFPGICRKKSR